MNSTEHEDVCPGRLFGKRKPVIEGASENNRLRGIPHENHKRPVTTPDSGVAVWAEYVTYGPEEATYPNLWQLFLNDRSAEISTS